MIGDRSQVFCADSTAHLSESSALLDVLEYCRRHFRIIAWRVPNASVENNPTPLIFQHDNYNDSTTHTTALKASDGEAYLSRISISSSPYAHFSKSYTIIVPSFRYPSAPYPPSQPSRANKAIDTTHFTSTSHIASLSFPNIHQKAQPYTYVASIANPCEFHRKALWLGMERGGSRGEGYR